MLVGLRAVALALVLGVRALAVAALARVGEDGWILGGTGLRVLSDLAGKSTARLVLGDVEVREQPHRVRADRAPAEQPFGSTVGLDHADRETVQLRLPGRRVAHADLGPGVAVSVLRVDDRHHADRELAAQSRVRTGLRALELHAELQVIGIALPLLLRDDGGLEVRCYGGRLSGLRGGDGGTGRERRDPGTDREPSEGQHPVLPSG